HFSVTDLHWISASPGADQLANLQVKIRHGETLYDCILTSLTPTSAHVQISGSDQGLAAGQFAVFYSGNLCLGAGTIQ
ncbi:tRNA 2-thiouridine(34) synthase MnmA, partial [Candidatus Peregrinibacteria bacterium]|nr:tRNA 2-thiouridine(34) synthase MnmA [Candidatus Peregrinibacteria bacterium]